MPIASWVRTSAPEKSVRAKAGARALTSVVTLAPPVNSRIVPGGAACDAGGASGFFAQPAEHQQGGEQQRLPGEHARLPPFSSTASSGSSGAGTAFRPR